MDSTLCIPDWIAGTVLRIPCPVEFAFIPWAELQIPMPRIADSTSKNFPDFEIQIALFGANMGKFSVPFFPAFLDLVVNREKLGRVLIVVKPALYSNLSSETTVEREFDIIVFIRG